MYTILDGKHGIKYAGVELESMRAVAKAYSARSLQDFERCLIDFEQRACDCGVPARVFAWSFTRTVACSSFTELVRDSLVSRHLRTLNENLLEQNLLRLVEPFSCVEIAHIAELIGLPLLRVEAKYVSQPASGVFVLVLVIALVSGVVVLSRLYSLVGGWVGVLHPSGVVVVVQCVAVSGCHK